MSMNTEPTTIRDFIYIDVERLYSFYSQVFGSVAEQIIKSVGQAHERTDAQSSSPKQGGSYEEQVSDLSQRTETAILHDYLYKRLEERLGETISDIVPLSRDEYQAVLSGLSFVKIRGVGEIEDYSRLQMFLNRFNEIGSGITHAVFMSPEHKFKVEVLQDMIQKEEESDKKAWYNNLLKQLKNEKLYAQANNLHQDEKVLSILELLTKLFASEGFDIVVSPMTMSSDENAVDYRAVLDKRWLRMRPDLLRALYSGAKQTNITMVGQVIYVPEPTATEPQVAQATEEMSLRERMRIMFSAMGALDQMYFHSSGKVEVTVLPLAIYREMSILIPIQKGAS